ncbi:MAG: hypothetical protein V7703_01265 [Hyphomicrobiales bacterium]
MYPHNEVTDPDYFRDVLGTMNQHGAEGAKVQFGLTGEGVAPNYLVTDSDGKTHPYHGRGHAPFKDAPDNQFAPNRLAPIMLYEDVRQQIKRCMSHKG